ncbi:MAG: threonylcarbamoyl-AMP synthase [candidate division Zixibacteria bacterium]|nr:threonylcarbamoyl-AMP synthase [candidate division Zixibacteria bacterium]
MIDSDRLDDLKKAAAIIQQGGIILAPTDTVWGLMCNYESAEAVASIFKIKKSPGKPVAIICDSIENIEKLQVEFSPYIRNIAKNYWPGPLTLIFKSGLNNIGHIAGNNNSIGVRIPDSEELRELVRLSGKPLAATSANITGQKQTREFDDIPDEITVNADFICKFDVHPSGVASTVIDCTSEKLKIIREGAISLEKLKKAMN